MIHHLSLAVQAPAHVSQVLAQIWQGQAFPFPIHPGSYIVFASGPPEGTCLEIYPLGTIMTPGKEEGEEIVYQQQQSFSPYGPTHAAISVPTSVEEILQIAQAQGWRALVCDRGPGCFHLVEFWVENRLLLELLTPEMVSEYKNFMTPENWQQFPASAAK